MVKQTFSLILLVIPTKYHFNPSHVSPLENPVIYLPSLNISQDDIVDKTFVLRSCTNYIISCYIRIV